MKMNFFCHTGFATTSLPVFAALALTAGATMAAESKPAPPTNAILESGLAAGLAVPEVKVTLEARRLPLRQVLAAVEKQTKVALTVAPDTFIQEPKLTLAVMQMPLREWMESLATLYDVRWEASGPGAFELQSSGRSEVARGLRRMGTEYNYWAWPFQRAHRPDYLPERIAPDWKGLVDNNLDLKTLNNTGVPLTDAPPELQQAVRAVVEHDIATKLLLDALLLDVAKGPLAISFAKPPGGAGWTVNKGRRNEKSSFTPYSVSADISGRYGVGVGRVELRPPSGGRELLNDPGLFAPLNPNAPNLTQVAAPAQGG